MMAKKDAQKQDDSQPLLRPSREKKESSFLSGFFGGIVSSLSGKRYTPSIEDLYKVKALITNNKACNDIRSNFSDAKRNARNSLRHNVTVTFRLLKNAMKVFKSVDSQEKLDCVLQELEGVHKINIEKNYPQRNFDLLKKEVSANLVYLAECCKDLGIELPNKGKTNSIL